MQLIQFLYNGLLGFFWLEWLSKSAFVPDPWYPAWCPGPVGVWVGLHCFVLLSCDALSIYWKRRKIQKYNLLRAHAEYMDRFYYVTINWCCVILFLSLLNYIPRQDAQW